MKLELSIDNYKQWFVWAWVIFGAKKLWVQFKVDTGCNSLVLTITPEKILTT